MFPSRAKTWEREREGERKKDRETGIRERKRDKIIGRRDRYRQINRRKSIEINKYRIDRGKQRET
jgi:hypothetical protein